jgi:hypothetical protein
MKKAAFHMITGLLAIGLMFGANLAQAQAGSLDTTFGTGGIVTTSFADGVAGVGELDTTFGTVDSFGVCCSVTSDQTFSGLLIQTDGKIVAIGGLDRDLAVARYLAN